MYVGAFFFTFICFPCFVIWARLHLCLCTLQVNDAKEQLWWNSTLHTSAEEPGSPGCAPDHSPLPNIPASDTLTFYSLSLVCNWPSGSTPQLRIHTTNMFISVTTSNLGSSFEGYLGFQNHIYPLNAVGTWTWFLPNKLNIFYVQHK